MELDHYEGPATMDKIVSLCKQRGFVFQSSEIYGGQAGAWDYGPLGIELKNRIAQAWWREMTQIHDNIVGLDAAIMMHPRVWEASGHVSNFTDPLVDCKKCHQRFRADQIPEENVKNHICPECGGELTDVRKFNLMFKTHIGPVEDDASIIYLRPETAQGIYVNYKNIVQSSRMKIPFGIAQIGKAFRNEIVTKNFIFRTCEFEQMEMQYFVKPGDDMEHFEKWKAERMAYYPRVLGINPAHLRFHQHGPDELAFYAKIAFDIEYLFPMGWKELEGIHNRNQYDITQHTKFSGKDLQYIDQEHNERYIPAIIETSAGLTRNVLMVLCEAYDEEQVPTGKNDGSTELRTVLRFHPRLAPITVAVLPLMKKDGLAELAQDIRKQLKEDFTTDYDQGGAIGRRYRRQDEAGTPFCVTVDYDSKEHNDVTLRFRDSMEQVRVPIAELTARIHQEIKNYKPWTPAA